MTKEALTTDLYLKAELELAEVARIVQRQESLNLEALSDLAGSIADAVRESDRLVVAALAGPSGPPLVTNLINVAILSAKVGIGLGFYGQELSRLVLAGLLHDIGLFAVPQSIITKVGRLTSDERTLIEQHPELGYQLIIKSGSAWEWLARVVRQAHERWNGQGYPNKLKGRSIDEFAQIIGVLDVFDALVTPRPYRRRFFPHEAVRELIVAERLAFPREVIKTLVEQLSIYPLGTIVRLTTGGAGTVVAINTHYPFRPVVEITEKGAKRSAPGGRRLDLSRLPLVSIIETLEPPDVTRIAFPASQPEKQPARSTLSDQFTSLLESLDAIASAIQSMVETRTTPDVPFPANLGSPGPQLPECTCPVPAVADATIDKEVIGLFALEAHEWLAQIHTALKQLARGTNGAARQKLYSIMLHGLTNLARSAATVHLSTIEAMASNLLPVLHDIGTQNLETTASAITALQAGLDRLAAAVRQTTGEKVHKPPAVTETTPETEAEPPEIRGDAEKEPLQEQQAFPPEPRPVPETALDQPPSPTMAAAFGEGSLVKAMRDLQQIRSRSVQPTRDVLESIILRAEEESGVVTADTVRRIIAELDHADEAFLGQVRDRVPRIIEVLSAIRQHGNSDFLTASQLDPVIEQVEALHRAAGHVQASMITMFLQGLQSFLLVAAYRKTNNLPERMETIVGRVQALIPMAEQWVNIGRLERASIDDILPPS